MRPPDIKSATGDSAQSAGVTGRSRQAAMDPEILLLVLDGSATIVGCNNVVCEFSGRRRHDLVGTPITAFLGSRDVETAISRSAPEGAGCAWIGTTRLGGTRRKVDWRLDPFAVDAGEKRYLTLAGIERAQGAVPASEHTAEREARLQAILDTAVDGIVTIDDSGIIESLNTATERIFGYATGELIGRNVRILMPDHYRKNHDRYIGNYLRTGHKKIIGIGREVEGRRKDGSTFPLDLAVSEFRVAGRPRFMGLMRDISSRKRAEREARLHLDELAHASRLSALGEMATGIAHEVNQPLAAIVSYAQACLNMMASEKSDPSVVRDALEQIAAQGRRAGDIVHRLRQFVRKERIERAPVDVNQCIQNVLTLFSHDLRASDAALVVELGENLPPVTADRVQIEQVTLNLLRNALEAASQHKASVARVEIESTRTKEHGVRVCVSDNGPGFEGEAPERLFETFYTTKPQGIGVGLSISRSIIESHGGNLQAEQNAMGGLDLCFTLPGVVSRER
jgi:two-component system sensor kinase FixL